MTGPVRIEREGPLAFIVIDNPPVNAGSHAVRQGLLDAIGDITADPAIKAGVLIGAGRTFIAGSDLKEFDLPLAEPQLPAVIAAIEALPKPIVAALHGAALGGGYELALGCDARIAAPGTVVGLPETTLGIIPGAGGTQRLPRLVGTAAAIEMVCSGRRVPAAEALSLGMIDAMAEGEAELRSAAGAHALALSGKAPVIVRKLPDEPAEAEERAAEKALSAGRGRPHIAAAIEHVRAAGRVPAAEGLAKERAAFERLRVSDEAKALRYVFFAEREAARGAAGPAARPRPVSRFGVVGAGTMGAGIAHAILQAGYPVALVERDPEALARGERTIAQTLGKAADTGRIGAGEAQEALARLTTGLDAALLSESDVIIEAVIEDLGVKQEVFALLDTVAKPGAVLATNTSYLDIDAIAEATGRPESVIGLHFFSPAHVMRLLEVVRGARTADDVLATGLAVARLLGKQPVEAGNGFGFIGNRIYAAYRSACEFMLEDGALPHEVDGALEAFGFAMGPFAVADLSGLDIAWHMRRQQAAYRDPASRYVTIPDQLCEAGRLGRKTGAGYYRYGENARRGERDPEVEDLIVNASAAAGRTRRPFSAEQIQRRALAAMINEAALVLSDGIARQPGDIDVVMVNGYGFPRWKGGPIHWARQQDPERIARECAAYAADFGAGKRRADLGSILSRR